MFNSMLTGERILSLKLKTADENERDESERERTAYLKASERFTAQLGTREGRDLVRDDAIYRLEFALNDLAFDRAAGELFKRDTRDDLGGV